MKYDESKKGCSSTKLKQQHEPYPLHRTHYSHEMRTMKNCTIDFKLI